MKFLQTVKNNIPNTITCLNLVSGSLAIIMAFRYSQSCGCPLTGRDMAFLLIAAAAVFDFCDGLCARLLHAYSDLGKELDSLADLISFGLAPAALIHNAILHFEGPEAFTFALLPIFIAVMAAVRLARFNIDTRQTTSFIGLPVPANAIFWIGLCAWMHSYTYISSHILMAVIIIGVSYLMVGPIHLFSLKFKNLSFRENAYRYFLIAGAVLFVVSYGLSGLLWTIALYIMISVVCRKYIF